MTGAATLTSCNSPVVKDPVASFVTSQRFYKAEQGLRNLNYKKNKKTVGEFVTTPVTIDLSDLPDSVCFPVSEWVKIKATLKEGNDYYRDFIKHD